MPLTTKTHTAVSTQTIVAVSVLAAAAAAFVVASITGETNDYLSIALRGDFNGDSYQDVAVCSDHFDSAGGVAIFLGARGTTAVTGVESVAAADVFIDGESTDDLAGFACATGDVNGDGIDDIIVGATGNDDAASGAGAAYAVLGSTTLASSSLSTAIQFTGEAVDDNAGVSVATGDVDGDGIDDIIVGSYNDDAASGAGAVYAVLGSTTLASSSLSTAIQFTGEAAGDDAAFVAAGDVNGDAIDDIIVGAINNDDGASGAGAAYAVLGSTTLASSSLSTAIQFTGEVYADIAGLSVAAGDVNGDGIDDIIVGSYNQDGGVDAGAVYVVLGIRDTIAGSLASSSLSTAIQLSGTAGDTVGWAVATGDMNGDAIDDIIVGAINNDDASTDAGAVYVVLGSSTWRTQYALTPGPKIRKFMGKTTGDHLGDFVGYAEGTGIVTPKLIIGARYNEDGGRNEGQVWLIDTLPGRADGYQRIVP